MALLIGATARHYGSSTVLPGVPREVTALRGVPMFEEVSEAAPVRELFEFAVPAPVMDCEPWLPGAVLWPANIPAAVRGC